MDVCEVRWTTWMSVRCNELRGCLRGAMNYIDVCEVRWTA